MKRFVAVFVCAVFAVGVLAIPSVAGAATTIKFGHIAPPFHGQSKGIDAFAEYVKEKTKCSVA